MCDKKEYCCPEAGHCVKSKGKKCASSSDCGKDTGLDGKDKEVCCPLTKLCVKVDKPCTSPCTGNSSYCCPEAKHCVTPVAPAPKMCKAAADCAAPAVCCPLLKICVSVGAACTPP